MKLRLERHHQPGLPTELRSHARSLLPFLTWVSLCIPNEEAAHNMPNSQHFRASGHSLQVTSSVENPLLRWDKGRHP